uniref:Uncharacterized protein n=1 Tax=Brassica campestris TaxID=3711 RepID=M4DXU2_BRACM
MDAEKEDDSDSADTDMPAPRAGTSRAEKRKRKEIDQKPYVVCNTILAEKNKLAERMLQMVWWMMDDNDDADDQYEDDESKSVDVFKPDRLLQRTFQDFKIQRKYKNKVPPNMFQAKFGAVTVTGAKRLSADQGETILDSRMDTEKEDDSNSADTDMPAPRAGTSRAGKRKRKEVDQKPYVVFNTILAEKSKLAERMLQMVWWMMDDNDDKDDQYEDDESNSLDMFKLDRLLQRTFQDFKIQRVSSSPLIYLDCFKEHFKISRFKGTLQDDIMFNSLCTDQFNSVMIFFMVWWMMDDNDDEDDQYEDNESNSLDVFKLHILLQRTFQDFKMQRYIAG